jgi:hypothetical protein
MQPSKCNGEREMRVRRRSGDEISGQRREEEGREAGSI